MLRLRAMHANSLSANILVPATADYRSPERQSSGASVGFCRALNGTHLFGISIQRSGDSGKNGKMTEQSSGQSPFTDLPGALVEEVMQRTDEVGRTLLQSFEHVRSERVNFRTKLQQTGRLGRDTDLEYPPIPPRRCSCSKPAVRTITPRFTIQPSGRRCSPAISIGDIRRRPSAARTTGASRVRAGK